MARYRLIAMFALAASLLAGCGILFPTSSYRFRMTVEVDTPQGPRSGSSVLEITSGLQNLPGKGKTPVTFLTGEAVAVDLSDEKTLFALTSDLPSGGGLEGGITRLFKPDAIGPDAFVASVTKLGRSDQAGRTVELPHELYPKLVTFRDIQDRMSVEAVDPANLVESFGPKVTLRRITAVLTNDKLTTGIQRRLPRPDARGFFNWDGRSNPNEGGVVGVWDFVRNGRR